MNKFEVWATTLCVLALMAAIPGSVYRWALVGLVVVPVGVAPVLMVI